jgi:hypothetical protein
MAVNPTGAAAPAAIENAPQRRTLEARRRNREDAT